FNDDAGNLDAKGVGLLFVGSDYRITPDMIVGALVQFDWAEDETGPLASKVEGRGWMAGPYISARIHENIYFDLRRLGPLVERYRRRRHLGLVRHLALAGEGHACRQLALRLLAHQAVACDRRHKGRAGRTRAASCS